MNRHYLQRIKSQNWRVVTTLNLGEDFWACATKKRHRLLRSNLCLLKSAKDFHCTTSREIGVAMNIIVKW